MGFRLVPPDSKLGMRMRLHDDTTVVHGDGGYAVWDGDENAWFPMPDEHSPRGLVTKSVGKRIEDVPDMDQPTKFDPFVPTTPNTPVGDYGTNTPDHPTAYSSYDKPKLRKNYL